MKKCGNVMVVAECYGEGTHPITFELLSKGREIADFLKTELIGILMGYNIKDKAGELLQYGADKIVIFDDEHLARFDVVLYKYLLVNLIKEERPELVLIGATRRGRSLAPRIAAALNTGLTADCIDIQVDANGDIIQVRPAFTGNIIAYIKTKSRPVMATVRYKVFKTKASYRGKGEIIIKKVKLPKDTGIRILRKERAKTVKISDAKVIVACGRGLKRREDIKMIEELAKLLDGIVGSSRPLVDEGWISRDYQIGFSGNIVKPKLYIACGISGSPQHLAGMRNSEIIIAINIDPSAPIFKIADYGIVGDLYEIIPRLVEKIKKRRVSDGRKNS